MQFPFQGQPACSCTDCESSCAAPSFPEPVTYDFEIFPGVSGVAFVMAVIFVVGSAVFLGIVFVSNTIKGGSYNSRECLFVLVMTFVCGIKCVTFFFFLVGKMMASICLIRCPTSIDFRSTIFK